MGSHSHEHGGIDLTPFQEMFFQEAKDLTADLESGLLRMDSGHGDPALLNAIFRAAHSIKGGAGMVGFDGICRLTHSMEGILDRMRAGSLPAGGDLIDLLLRATDVLKEAITAAESGSPPPGETGPLIAEMDRALNNKPGSAVSAEATRGLRRYRIHFEPAQDVFLTGIDPLQSLRELSGLGRFEELLADPSRLPGLDELDPERCYLSWSILLESDCEPDRIDAVFEFVRQGARIEIITESAPPAQVPGGFAAAPAGLKASAAAADSASIRVSTEKVDKLVDLVGELVIAQSMASAILPNFTASRLNELKEALSEIDRHTRELQERVMAVRMLPISTVFGRLPRLVRDLAAATGKQLELEISGEDTELDKAIVERIVDPLTHLIRNAADHGIESAEERRKAGKRPQGVIQAKAFHEGGNIVVEVSDDGRGLDLERIRQKGIARGLIGPHDELNEQQLHSLIFHPGFSTADSVTGISGRGVGMDVVRQNVEALGGSISLSSVLGKGSSFRIRLPLTLAIMDGLSVRVGAETFLAPLVSVVETIQPAPSQLKTVAGEGELVLVRQEPIPLVRLNRLFRIDGAVDDPSLGLVVLAEIDGRRMALLVDELLGQQQVVIKSIETHYRKVEGILGATILGNGRVALILDLSGVWKLAGGGQWTAARPEPAAA
jgi:two-component system chemotaxis sensor kinase CheA